ncbi:MAG: hypothetical protein ABFD82_02730 [Syntrophaceae bacterium]
MKFISYDCIEKVDCVTEIRSADSGTIRDFSLLWDTFVDDKILREKDKDFNYRIFQWDKIIHMSVNFGFDYTCYAAYTGTRLDGLLSLRNQNALYLDFFATAPWNYFGTAGKMRRIGSGLIYFTIQTSLSLRLDGEFILYALEDAEKYCEKIGMAQTGHFKFGLREYRMAKEKAAAFEKVFSKFIINHSL